MQTDGMAAQPARVPMFSFLTTAYRAEDTLARTIDSVRAQTRDDWELVVVDNGMDDAIEAVVHRYRDDARIRLFRQENKGPSGGVMAAAALARGRFFVMLNSDDTVSPLYCARMGATLDACPDIDVLCCDAFLFSDPGTVRQHRSYLRNAGQRGRPAALRRLRLADVLDGPCPYYSAAVRREVWTALGGVTTDTPVVDDLDLWLRALSAGHDVREIPDVLCGFRFQAGSESRPVDPERLLAFEAQRELALTRVALASGRAEDLAALNRTLRAQRHMRALRDARLALRARNLTLARVRLTEAVELRRAPRVLLMHAAITVAPRWTTRLYLLKRALQGAVPPSPVDSPVRKQA